MLSHTVARRYAKGLIEAVHEIAPGTERAVNDELASVVETVDGHSGLKLLLVNPAIPATQKQAILGKISEKLAAGLPVQRFLALLAERQRLDHLALIAAAYEKLVDEHLGVVTAAITTSAALNPGQLAQLEASLREATDGEVRLEQKVDGGLLGGVITRIGDVVYDGSVKGHLERIRERLRTS